MSYRNAIPDIAPGSIWECFPKNLAARVIAAAAGHVAFRVAGERPRIITSPEREFRRDFRPIYDRERVRQQFSMSLANLGEFRVFWSPGVRRIIARATSCRREFRVPQDAILVGRYRAPAKADAFLEDLDCVIEEIGCGHHAAATGAAP